MKDRCIMQLHKMIFWGKPKKESFKEISQRAYQVIQLLDSFGEDLKPKYFTAFKKSEAEQYDGTYNTLYSHLKRGVNREGNVVYEDLGYSISFFSSMDNKRSAGIRMTLGVSHKSFVNTLIIKLPQAMDVYSKHVANNLTNLFKELIGAFNPFWGCIVNDLNVERYEGDLYKNHLPSTVHWLNFFGEDTVNKIGLDKIKQAPFQEVVEVGSGYFLKLKEYPIDDFSSEDVALQAEVNRFLGLSY